MTDDDPRLIARRIVFSVLAEASHSHPDPAVRRAAEAELLERHAAVALAMRRTGEAVARSFDEIVRVYAAALQPLVAFVSGLTRRSPA